MTEPLRVANCSGFYGDRLAAAREMVDGGPIDVLTGDWLAELTMLILWKGIQRDPSRGWAHTFLTQMEEVLGTCVDRGIKVVTNAGGLNPAGLADQLHLLSDRLGLSVSVAHVEGDDLLPRIDELRVGGHPLAHLDTGAPLERATGTVVSANAYLGAWPIVGHPGAHHHVGAATKCLDDGPGSEVSVGRHHGAGGLIERHSGVQVGEWMTPGTQFVNSGQQVVTFDVGHRHRQSEAVGQHVELVGQTGRVESAGVGDHLDTPVDAGAEHLLHLGEEGVGPTA